MEQEQSPIATKALATAQGTLTRDESIAIGLALVRRSPGIKKRIIAELIVAEILLAGFLFWFYPGPKHIGFSLLILILFGLFFPKTFFKYCRANLDASIPKNWPADKRVEYEIFPNFLLCREAGVETQWSWTAIKSVEYIGVGILYTLDNVTTLLVPDSVFRDPIERQKWLDQSKNLCGSISSSTLIGSY